MEIDEREIEEELDFLRRLLSPGSSHQDEAHEDESIDSKLETNRRIQQLLHVHILRIDNVLFQNRIQRGYESNQAKRRFKLRTKSVDSTWSREEKAKLRKAVTQALIELGKTRYTAVDDDQLLALYDELGDRIDWKNVAETALPWRHPDQCKQAWEEIREDHRLANLFWSHTEIGQLYNHVAENLKKIGNVSVSVDIIQKTQEAIIEKETQQLRAQKERLNDPAMIAEIDQNIAALKTQISQMYNQKMRQFMLLLSRFAHKIDWKYVANYVRRRSSIQCQQRWIRVQDPRIRAFLPIHEHASTQGLAFSSTETNVLNNKVLSTPLDAIDWDSVLKNLRSGGFHRTQQATPEFPQEARTRSSWSSDEDEALIDAVETHGKRWILVADEMQENGFDRDADQCLQRWTFTLDPSIKKGPWTEEEDEQLRVAVQDLRARNVTPFWVNVAKYVPGKTEMQCRERWERRLSPHIVHTKFSDAEDRLLLNLADLHRQKWSIVAREFNKNKTNKRSDSQLLKRYQALLR